MEISIDLVKPSPYQPRLIFGLEDLKSEIEKDGLLSDLVVRKQGEAFELIDGERRWRALKELGWQTVPARLVEMDDVRARRAVYKLNKIRKNYTSEEEAKYFRRLTREGRTPWDISRELNVDYHWVVAHLNVFKFPEDVQKAVWSGQISVSHIVALENVINRDIKEAHVIVNEILKKRLTVDETRKIVRRQEAKIEKKRLEAAEKILNKITPEAVELKSPEDFEKAAETLKKMAKRKREETMAPEEKAAREAEKRRRWQERARLEKDEIVWAESEAKEEDGSNLTQTLTILREKIKMLEVEKSRLLEMKDYFIAKAMKFNCPHCNKSCTIYREGDRYWVE